MISAHPRQHYQIDCLKLHKELCTDRYKILICIVDHFSKFLHVRLSETQTGIEVEITVKQFFRLLGLPIILQSDNGREFVNERITILLDNNNVEFVHGRPYHPESQGCIERAHRTLQNGLKKVYIEQKNNFYIVSALETCLDSYNSEVHTTTKMRPIDAIKLDPNNSHCQNDIDFVIYNTKCSRKNVKDKLVGYEEGDKLLLYNSISKAKANGLLEEVRGRFHEKKIKGYLIPATVIGIGENLLEVRIDQNFDIISGQLKKDEIYKIEEHFVLQVGEEAWKRQVDIL